MTALFAALALIPALFVSHPLDGRIWDTRAGSFIDAETVWTRAAAARFVLLGENHDNTTHHQLQLDALRALDARGRQPALAMEQFDHEQQAALSRAQAAGERDAEALASAGRLDRTGWRWPMYRDLIAYAAERSRPLLAANLARSTAREIALGRLNPDLPPADDAQQAAMESDIVRGHCGQRPPPERLARLVAAQRSRDARMAATLMSAPGPHGAVLIAGGGHVRRDRAVPRYLDDPGAALSIVYIEVIPGRDQPTAYDTAGFDLVWFTPPARRPDPCASLPGGVVSGAVPARAP